MDAKRCDRCGEFYIQPVLDSHTSYKTVGRPIVAIDVLAPGIHKQFDLCPKCADEFRKFFGEDITNLH